MCNKKDSNNLELCARLSIVSEPRFGSGNSTGIATAQAFKLKPPRHMFSSVPYEDNMVVNIHLTRRHAIMPAWPWRVYCCDYYLVYSSVQVILFPIHEELVHRAQVGGSCSVRRKTIRDAQRQKKNPRRYYTESNWHTELLFCCTGHQSSHHHHLHHGEDGSRPERPLDVKSQILVT